MLRIFGELATSCGNIENVHDEAVRGLRSGFGQASRAPEMNQFSHMCGLNYDHNNEAEFFSTLFCYPKPKLLRYEALFCVETITGWKQCIKILHRHGLAKSIETLRPSNFSLHDGPRIIVIYFSV